MSTLATSKEINSREAEQHGDIAMKPVSIPAFPREYTSEMSNEQILAYFQTCNFTEARGRPLHLDLVFLEILCRANAVNPTSEQPKV